MTEIEKIRPASADELRNDVKRQLGQLDPGLRVIAEDVMGLASAIDLVAVDGRGEVVILMLALEGEDDAALLTRTLAQRAWVAGRVRDWAKLAPELEIARDARVRAILLAPAFGAETRAAASSFRAGTLELVRYVSLRVGGTRGLLLEPVGAGHSGRRSAPQPARRPGAPLPVFRSNLTDDDLGAKPAQDDRSRA